MGVVLLQSSHQESWLAIVFVQLFPIVAMFAIFYFAFRRMARKGQAKFETFRREGMELDELIARSGAANGASWGQVQIRIPEGELPRGVANSSEWVVFVNGAERGTVTAGNKLDVSVWPGQHQIMLQIKKSPLERFGFGRGFSLPKVVNVVGGQSVVLYLVFYDAAFRITDDGSKIGKRANDSKLALNGAVAGAVVGVGVAWTTVPSIMGVPVPWEVLNSNHPSLVPLKSEIGWYLIKGAAFGAFAGYLIFEALVKLRNQ